MGAGGDILLQGPNARLLTIVTWLRLCPLFMDRRGLKQEPTCCRFLSKELCVHVCRDYVILHPSDTAAMSLVLRIVFLSYFEIQ